MSVRFWESIKAEACVRSKQQDKPPQGKMLLFRRSAKGLPRSTTATCSRGISKLSACRYHHPSYTDDGCRHDPRYLQAVAGPLPTNNAPAGGTRSHSTVTASSGRKSSSNVSSTFERLNLSPGPGSGDAPRTSSAGRARDKSTAVALMEEEDDDEEPVRPGVEGSGAGDTGGDSLTSFRLTGEVFF